MTCVAIRDVPGSFEILSDFVRFYPGYPLAAVEFTIYIVAEYAEQRKKMLQWWGDYVDSIVTESKVIVGHFGGVA